MAVAVQVPGKCSLEKSAYLLVGKRTMGFMGTVDLVLLAQNSKNPQKLAACGKQAAYAGVNFSLYDPGVVAFN